MVDAFLLEYKERKHDVKGHSVVATFESMA